jgi:PAS domain S-box-containing protein
MSAALYDLLPVAAWRLDPSGAPSAFNRAARALLGVDDDDAAVSALVEAIHDGDRAGLLRTRAHARSFGRGYRTTYRLRRFDGAQRWIEERGEMDPGEPGAMVCCGVDVTDRVARERGVDSASQFLNALLAAIPTPFYVIDTEQSLIIVNDAFCRLVGRDRFELIGARIDEVMPPELAARLVAGDRAAMESEGPTVAELALEQPAGGTGHYLVHRSSMQVDDGHVLVSIVSDITALKSLERRLVAAHEAALGAARAKSNFLANMSHEIRTPMNGVLGMLTLLLDGALGEEEREYVVIAHGSAQSLLALLNDVLDFSKIEAGHMALEDVAFDARALASEVVKLHEPMARARGLTLGAAIAPDIPALLRGDSLRLRQVMGNLLSNAIKFTKEGHVELRLWVRETRLVLEVEDSGIGMAPETCERIFAPFTQEDTSVSRRFGGTGLGLAICRELVSLMGGAIQVRSEAGRGSTFTVDLPLREGPPDAHDTGAHPEPVSARAAAGALRVLVVDDNAVNRVVAQKMLSRLGHEPQLAHDGREAVVAAAQGGYDVIVMDVQMPEVDGLEATRAIRDHERLSGRPHVPIVALTAHASASDAERCREAGMDHYLTKPLSLTALANVLAGIEAANPDRSLAQRAEDVLAQLAS